MATASVIKLKVRRGSDASRQLVILDQGEIGYTTDSKRLFVGDGSTAGGISTGAKFYVTPTGIPAAVVNGADLLYTIQTGDIVYDTSTNPTHFYILTGSNSGFNSLASYAPLVVTQTNTIYYNVSSTVTSSLAISAITPTISGNQTIFTITGAASGSVFNQIQNLVAGVSASTDVSIYNDLGVNYVDLGINSSKYNGNSYGPVFNVVGPNDSYLFATTANFGIGNTGTNGDLIFFTGGSLSGVKASGGNEVMRVTNSNGTYSGNVGIGTSTPGVALTVNGAISSNNNIYANGNVFGGTNINVLNGTSYTIQLSDNGGTIASTNTTTGLTALVNSTGYPVGFQTAVIQLSTARVALSGNGFSVNQANLFYKTTKQYSAATLLYTGTIGGWVVFGDVSA